MSGYQLTPLAIADLFEIWSFIAEDNPPAAERVEQAVFHACQLLADSPLLGKIRTDLTLLPVRVWPVQAFFTYLIVYRPETKPLQILRVLHTSRDLRLLLR